ncbi:MAG: hypothetical protein HC919_01995 [Oscillatoriales cyanobacterium SM2_2_1]|nr:hypothetical protein [Oscillatoriales cyanobacterium SM2_2_1]
MSLLPQMQRYVRSHPAKRHWVRSPDYDERLGFGDVTPRLSTATLLEEPMRAISIGTCALDENHFNHFADGIQRSWLLFYQDYVPVYYGYVAAVVRQRQQRLMSQWRHRAIESLYLPRALCSLEIIATLSESGIPITDTQALTEPEDLQPNALRDAARAAITEARQSLETQLASEWITHATEDDWLVLDGSLTISAAVAEHPRIIGLVKSHNTQYVRFPEQEVILNLRLGERSAAFMPPGRHRVCSWYLRLHQGSGDDLYFGLVRVEAALPFDPERVTEISRWVMTERRPLALPDSRWDRMIYPIRDCEQFLRSHEPGRSAFGWLG